MLKPLVKRLLKSIITVVRRVPPLFALSKWTLLLFPRFESLARRIVQSSLTPALSQADKLSDAEIRILIDLLDAISAKQEHQE